VAGLKSAMEEVEDLGGRAIIIPADVSDAEQVEAAAVKTEEELGPIDVWINNAMVSVFSPFKEMQPEEFRRVTEVTYLGYVYGTMAALQRMLPRNHGRIIQVTSALAHRSIPLQSAYCGAKHAIKGFTESVQTELVHDRSKVRISMVALPGLNTPQFEWVKSRLPNKPKPVPPVYQPELAARTIYWASRHMPREMLLGFPTWEAVLGEKFSPKLLNLELAKDGYASQQTSEPDDPERPNNLWEPVPEKAKIHGPFSAISRKRSVTFYLRKNRGAILGTCALLAVAGGLLMRKRGNV
jgi:NAD(P)-dependent dehydrogenase (short-subunit alcohol dehydrogenase family)